MEEESTLSEQTSQPIAGSSEGETICPVDIHKLRSVLCSEASQETYFVFEDVEFCGVNDFISTLSLDSECSSIFLRSKDET